MFFAYDKKYIGPRKDYDIKDYDIMIYTQKALQISK